MTPAELERRMRADIPLASALGVRVLEVGPAGVLLAAPLAPNVNH